MAGAGPNTVQQAALAQLKQYLQKRFVEKLDIRKRHLENAATGNWKVEVTE